MSKEREALKLALEALEETRNALAWFYDSYPQDVTKKGNELLPHVETVLAAIRKALAEQPARQEFICSTGLCHYKAQQQEPAAMRYDFDGYGYKYIDAGSGSDWQTRIKDAEPVYASPREAQQESVATIIFGAKRGFADTPEWAYPTAPPASQSRSDVKPWVGLTKEEIEDAWPYFWRKYESISNLAIARAIEAKLREKNEHKEKNT